MERSMANVNTVSFGPGQANVDLQAQQVQLQRQQQMADMLRQQATTPMETQVVSGRAVKNSPLLGVAQLAKALLANRMQAKNDEKQTELGNVAAQRSADALRALVPAGVFDSAPGSAHSGPLPDEPLGEPGSSPAQNPQPMPSTPQGPQMSPETRAAYAGALNAYKLDPELGRKLLSNLLEKTGNQKDWETQGVDPRELGRAMLNKERAGGLVNVAPNNTVLDAGTGKPMYAAPDFANGRNNTFGPNGAPQMAPIQGSEMIPQQAGAIEAAKAAAQAGYQLKEYTGADNKPRLATVGQVVGAAGQPQQQPGQPPNQGFPPGAQLPQPTPGMQSRTEILQQELAAAQADPRRAADVQAIQRELAGAQKVGSMPGIPLQTPAAAAQQVGQVNNQLAIEKARVEAAQSPEAIAKLTDAQGVVGLTGMARQILSDGKATGSLGGTLRDKVAGAVGVSTKSSQAAAQLAAIGGALVSKQPKMTGPQSDKDVLLYQQMAGRIGDASVPLGDRLAALDVVEGINKKYLDNNQNSIASEALGANTRNGKIRKYNPDTGKIE
jgi:hypothetical protein